MSVDRKETVVHRGMMGAISNRYIIAEAIASTGDTVTFGDVDEIQGAIMYRMDTGVLVDNDGITDNIITVDVDDDENTLTNTPIVILAMIGTPPQGPM